MAEPWMLDKRVADPNVLETGVLYSWVVETVDVRVMAKPVIVEEDT